MFGKIRVDADQYALDQERLAELEERFRTAGPYMDTAMEIHERHVGLLDAVGTVAVDGSDYDVMLSHPDAYEAAVAIVGAEHASSVLRQAADLIVEHRGEGILAKMLEEAREDPQVERMAAEKLSSPEVQAELANQAQQRAVAEIIEKRRAAEEARFVELFERYHKGEVERAALIAELNYEFVATGMVDTSIARLTDILEHGDQLVLELERKNRSISAQSTMTFEWVEAEGTGFVYVNNSTSEGKVLSVKGAADNNFWSARPVMNLGSTAGSNKSNFSDMLVRGTSVCTREDTQRSPNAYGRLYIVSSNSRDGDSAMNEWTRAAVKGAHFVQRTIANTVE